MRKKTTLIIILLLTISTLFSISINNISSAQPLQKTVNRTLYVGGTGPNNYTSIQDAVNNSLDEDTIFVYNGIYDEPINVNKELTIKGEQEKTTFLNKSLTIKKNNTRVSNFTSVNNFFSYGSNIIIDNCTFKHTGGGPAAIDIRNDNVVIENCTITGAYWRGIDCANYWGYSIYPKSNITIRRCLIENTWQHPWDNPSYAIGRIGGNGLITECTFFNNTCALYSISNSMIYRNNFVSYPDTYSDGVGNVYDNLWNSTYPVGGNYWTHYNGTDNYCGEEQNIPGPDGIGDTPHSIVNTNPPAYDYYPLIDMYCPWDNTPPEITLIKPENNTVMRTEETKYVQINVYDPHLRNISYKINNQEWSTTKEKTLLIDTGEWVEDGFYNITLDAVDYNNNHAFGFYSFNIDNTPPSAPGKPIYENDEPGSNIDRDGKVVSQWTPTVDANPDMYEVWLSINNEPYTHVFNTPYNYTTINGTTSNNYTIAVVAVDKIGLKSTQSPVSDTITINITIILPEIIIQETDATTTNDTFTIHWAVTAGAPTSYEISIDGQTWTDVGLITHHTFQLGLGQNTLYVRGKTNQYTGNPCSITVTRTNNQTGNNETGNNNESEQKTPFPWVTIIIIVSVIIAILIFILIIYRKKQKTQRGEE